MKYGFKLTIFGVFLAALIGCGVKGDPVPYVESKPESVKPNKGG